MRTDNIVNEKRKVLFRIPKEMSSFLAESFLSRYSLVAKDKRCIGMIKELTHNSRYERERYPVMYGFYSLMEEYEGIDKFIDKELSVCSSEVKNLLSDLAVVTRYSQNIHITYSEISKRLGLPTSEIQEIDQALGEGVLRLISPRKEGYRICHKLIADKIIKSIHSVRDGVYYSALMNFINNKYSIFGEDEDFVVETHKEIFAMRDFIDGEVKRFSEAINDITGPFKKKKIFERLKFLYPNNPYYFTQLGRLYALDYTPNYNKAFECFANAIKVADENGLEKASHQTTFGCIYSKRLRRTMNIIKNDKRHQGLDVSEVLDRLLPDYRAASEQFNAAKNSKQYTTYAYVPYINMITSVIVGMADLFGNINDIIEEEPFGRWYDENINIAVDLYKDMEEKCSENDVKRFRDTCMVQILKCRCDIDELRKRKVLSRKDKSELNRAITSLLYFEKSEAMKTQALNKEIEQLMFENITSGIFSQNDVYAWFDAYRQLPEFDITHSINTLYESLEEGYKKNYYLFLLKYSLYEKGLISYADAEQCLTKCQNYTKQDYGLKTSKVLDAVFGNEVAGFAIQSVRKLERRDGEWSTDILKTYTGIIKNIKGSTAGSAIIDKSNTEVFLTPVVYSRGSDAGQIKSLLTKSDEGKTIAFKLMFSYDGPKAWSVEIIK